MTQVLTAKTDQLRESFREQFHAEPRLFRAPGRVNLIGEHTDYNQGFVMPVAIDFETWVAAAPKSGNCLTIRSVEFSETVEFELHDTSHQRSHWSDYIRGVVLQLLAAGYKLPGAELLIDSSVPMGAGLSSSASLEVATGFAMLSLAGVDPDKRQLASLAQRAENEFVGAHVGIMDQFICCNGIAGHALMLDCRSLDFTPVPIPPRTSLVIANTMVKHSIAGGEYNLRRRECEEAVSRLKQELPDISYLRDVSIPELERFGGSLPPLIFKRAMHVVSENQRVLEAANALQSRDVFRFGQLMYESHRSLRDLYEVSSPELDVMVELASHLPGVHGSRMTGGGFGGCTVTLVETTRAEQVRRELAGSYARITGITPEVYISTASDGVSAL
jgi:galactokinase